MRARSPTTATSFAACPLCLIRCVLLQALRGWGTPYATSAVRPDLPPASPHTSPRREGLPHLPRNSKSGLLSLGPHLSAQHPHATINLLVSSSPEPPRSFSNSTRKGNTTRKGYTALNGSSLAFNGSSQPQKGPSNQVSPPLLSPPQLVFAALPPPEDRSRMEP